MDTIKVTPEVSPEIGDEPIYILDTETASLSGGIVEIAWLKIDKDFNVLDEYRTLVNPGRPIDPGAQAIHGISMDDVVDAPTMEEVVEQTGVGKTPINICCHNAPFDARMIAPYMQVGRKLCTLELARQYVKGTTNHKLATLQEELALSVQESHTALGDVKSVRDLLQHILPLAEVNLETLFARAMVPKMLSKMPWGRHKDVPIIKVPSSYRTWLLEQADIGRDLRFTLEKLKNI